MVPRGRDRAGCLRCAAPEEVGVPRGGRRPEGGGKPFRGEREGGGKPYRAADRDEKPRGKPGWDGKPREKKYFRKDG